MDADSSITDRDNGSTTGASSSADVSLKLAMIAQALYLFNLLALPGITMIALGYVTWRYRNSDDKLGVCHLWQATILSLWMVVIVVGGTVLIWLIVGHIPMGLSMAILYAIVMHTAFVLIGIIALASAISGKHFHSTKAKHCG